MISIPVKLLFQEILPRAAGLRVPPFISLFDENLVFIRSFLCGDYRLVTSSVAGATRFML